MEPLDQLVQVSERRHRNYVRQKKAFEEFRSSAIEFFNGAERRDAMPWLRALESEEAESLIVQYLGRQFFLKFSPVLVRNDLVGRVIAFEKDNQNVNVAKKVATLEFQTNGHASNLKPYSDDDPVYLGESTADTIYIILQLLEQALAAE